MLKIIGSEVCQSTEMEFGDYLPFKFWCQPQRTGTHLYWRTGNMQSTLLEVEVDQIDGKIVGVSLPLPGYVSSDFPMLDLSNATRLNGYPMVEVSDWPDDRFKDAPNLLQVFADTNRLLILFSDSSAALKVISSQDVTFGVDANDFMVWILVKNLHTENLDSLKNL